ncbi:trifunctional serine/threonine-protein kinase/ATP-binding protein/sensor histidine kinase [Rhodopseudomonas telluris]|uniref:histidine kinase n=1 Tax=Rhodopseudomonas telluris TaxID=644215 RepID=A0ABV6EWK8_9BRAD
MPHSHGNQVPASKSSNSGSYEAIDPQWWGDLAFSFGGLRDGVETHLAEDTSGRKWRVRSAASETAGGALLEREAAIAALLGGEVAELPAHVGRGEKIVLIYPAWGRQALADMAAGEVAFARFLEIAERSALSLARVHASDIVHGTLDPTKLIIADDGRVRFSEFGRARVPGQELEPASLPQSRFKYAAPEQARRDRPALDARSDLYSLGVILYEFLVGRPPLLAGSIAEWLHAQVAIDVPAPSRVRLDLAPAIDGVLLKLLAKDPDQRYQMAEELHADLKQIRIWPVGAVEDDGSAKAKRRLAVRARLAESLVGRSREFESLVRSLANVRQSGRAEVVLLAGAPGAGKSSLVGHLLKHIRPGDAICATGKGDPLRKAIPFAPIVQALRSALLALATGDHNVREDARSRLAEVPGSGRLLADLIPDVALPASRSAPLPDVPAHLAQIRTTRIIRETFAAIATARAPLVLFLDDLQWFDGASLDVVQALLDARSSHMLLICSHRSEDGGERPWSSLADEARASDIPCTEMSLAPLTTENTAELIAFVLDHAIDEVGELSAIVHRETQGNPFYIGQLVQKFTDEETVSLDAARQTWVWDQSRLLQGMTVIEFMARRLEALPQLKRRFLHHLSCLSRRASIEVLSGLAAIPLDEAGQLADKLVQDNLLSRAGEYFTFSHDRIREAAYSLVPQELRSNEHLRIARYFLAAYRCDDADLAFDIATQIERSDRNHLNDNERVAFAQILLTAARSSRSTGAARQALRFLDVARDIQTRGSSERFASFAIEWLRCDCLLALARVEETLEALGCLLAVAATPIEIADTYRLRAVALTVRSDYVPAIEAALHGLSAVGIEIERFPDLHMLERLYNVCCERLDVLTPSGVLDLPEATDEVARTALALLSTLSSSFFVPGELRFLHALKIVEITLEFGLTPESAYGLAWFGVFGAHHYQAYETGRLWAELACRIAEREGYEAQRAAALIALDQVSVWTKPMRFALDRAREGARVAEATGDLGMACYARNHIASNLLVLGAPLDAVRAEVSEGQAKTIQIGYRDIERILNAQMGLITALMMGESHHVQPPGDDVAISIATRFWVHHYAGVIAFLFDQSSDAQRHLAKAMDLAWSAPAHIDTSYSWFFLALTVSRSAIAGRPADDAIACFAAARARFAEWAQLNPDTFQTKHLLLEAEAARLDGDGPAAQRLYERAAQAADRSGFIHEQALAYELAGQYYLEAGLFAPAQGCLIAAGACYRQWGAAGKATHLARRFPRWATTTDVVGDGTGQRDLDLAALTAAAQTLAEEVGLEQVLRTLMRSMVVHAGAQFGLFLLVQDGVAGIEAAARVENQEIRVDLYCATPTDDDLPLSLLTTVIKSKKAITFADVQADAPQMDAAGPRHRGARALACIPFVKRGDLVGILYLENSLSVNVFTPGRTAMLEVLAAQAATSLDAARLYRNLIDENRRRAAAEFQLREARAELGRTSQMTALGSFAASIVHEINQPIASILTQTEAALRWLNREQPEIAEATQGLTRIRNSGRRTADIVKSLRALGKQAPTNFSSIHLEEVVEEVIRLIAEDLEAGHVRLAVELSEHRRLVLADRVQIQQVIFNLVTNAIHAMEAVERDTRSIVLRTSDSSDGNVRLTIEDSGCGMSDEVLSKIFAPFFTTKANGMGVGLAICRSIVEMHRGTISVRSTIGQGSTFEIKIPFLS